jgi:hypothetical protein
MSYNHIEITQYLGHQIEATAVEIGSMWYPLFRVLLGTHPAHPWQVPAVDGTLIPEDATTAGTALAKALLTPPKY